jgi:hypothetical protein
MLQAEQEQSWGGRDAGYLNELRDVGQVLAAWQLLNSQVKADRSGLRAEVLEASASAMEDMVAVLLQVQSKIVLSVVISFY